MSYYALRFAFLVSIALGIVSLAFCFMSMLDGDADGASKSLFLCLAISAITSVLRIEAIKAQMRMPPALYWKHRNLFLTRY